MHFWDKKAFFLAYDFHMKKIMKVSLDKLGPLWQVLSKACQSGPAKSSFI